MNKQLLTVYKNCIDLICAGKLESFQAKDYNVFYELTKVIEDYYQKQGKEIVYNDKYLALNNSKQA